MPEIKKNRILKMIHISDSAIPFTINIKQYRLIDRKFPKSVN
jgi:hypothetical protein